MKAELLISGFLVELKLPLSHVDHTTKLFRNIFRYFKIENKNRCGRTKTTHMLPGAIANQVTGDLKEELLLTRWYGLATYTTSNENGKCLPVIVRYVDKDSGLIATSLLDMQNINSNSKAQKMYDVCSKVKEVFSLDWDYYVTYSSDNTNSRIGKRYSLLHKLRSVRMTKIFLTLVALFI